MKQFIAPLLIAAALLPTQALAGVRDQYNQSVQQESDRNNACLTVWNKAQFRGQKHFRFHVDEVGNITELVNGHSYWEYGQCALTDRGRVNIEQNDGNLTTYSYHIESEGLVYYASQRAIPNPLLTRRVYPFR